MGAVIYVDTRQQAGKHVIKDEWWASHGVSTTRVKLDFGDYMTDGSNISVDTKRNIAEIAQNINGKEHDRFKRECQRAAAAGYRLIILVENSDGVYNFDSLTEWTNDHCRYCGEYKKKKCDPRDSSTKCAKHGTRKPIQGDRLAKAMQTMAERYGVRFAFCPPDDSARLICSLLGVGYKALCRDCFRYVNGVCVPACGGELTEGPARIVDGQAEMCERGCPF